jgi:CspA family cold shock protein
MPQQDVDVANTVARSTPDVPGNQDSPEDAARLQSRVKWFDVKKGFGFIVGPQGEDVFVHFSSIAANGFRTLKDGEEVTYCLVEGDKGLHARDVQRLDPEPRPRDQDERPVRGAARRYEGKSGRFQQEEAEPVRPRIEGYVG